MAITEERKIELRQQRIANLARGRAQAAANKAAKGAKGATAGAVQSEGSIPLPKPQPTGHKTLLDETIEKEQKQQKPPAIIIPSMLNAFSHNQGTQAVDYIVRSGDDIKDLLMRTNFQSSRHVRALARIIAKARAANNKEAETEALFVAAGDVSIGGESREQLIRAIVGGDPRSVSKGRMNFADKGKKLKDFVFGDKDKEGSDDKGEK